MQISMDSIFPEGKDVNVCISRAAKSIGLKEIPHYDVKMGEQYDWIRKTQVDLLFIQPLLHYEAHYYYYCYLLFIFRNSST